jgi:predicted nucleic acid-binding protein
MAIVIDASMTMAWCFEDEASDDADAVLDRVGQEGAVVPSLWRLEVANVLLVAERRGRLTEAQATRFLTLLGQLPIEVAEAGGDTAALLGAARVSGLSAYDAAYLLLAEVLGAPLATFDAGLADAARAAGLTLLPQRTSSR